MTTTSTTSITFSNGYFTINGETMTLSDAMMALNIDRTQALDAEIATQMEEIQDRNNDLAALNELLSKCREFRGDKKDSHDDESQGEKFTVGLDINNDGVIDSSDEKNAEGWFDYFGISMTDVNPNDDTDDWEADWDLNIENLKGSIDTLNSDSQLDMIRLQSLIDKRDQAFEMTTSLLKSTKQLAQTILQGY